MLAAISASHLSPLSSNFSLLYNNSWCVSVENSKFGPYKKNHFQVYFNYVRSNKKTAASSAEYLAAALVLTSYTVTKRKKCSALKHKNTSHIFIHVKQHWPNRAFYPKKDKGKQIY